MSTTSTTGTFCDTNAPGSTVRFEHEAVHRRDDDGVAEIDAELVEARLRLRALRPRQVDRRDGRLVPRLVVVERLLGQQLPFEEVARALGVGLRQLQVGFALADGRFRHLLRGFRLLDLLLDLEVLDLGEPLAAGHAIAEPHG